MHTAEEEKEGFGLKLVLVWEQALGEGKRCYNFIKHEPSSVCVCIYVRDWKASQIWKTLY